MFQMEVRVAQPASFYSQMAISWITSQHPGFGFRVNDGVRVNDTARVGVRVRVTVYSTLLITGSATTHCYASTRQTVAGSV